MGYDNTLAGSGQTAELAKVETTRERVMRSLSEAQAALRSAYATGVQSNPLAQDVLAFQKMKDLQTQVTTIMQDISKMRGL